MFKPKLFVAFLLLIAALCVARADRQTDYAKALETAKAQNKRVLLDFTGSDWCGPCIELNKRVFSSREFRAYADKNLVFVEVDYPRLKKQSAALVKQNENWRRNMGLKKKAILPWSCSIPPEGASAKGWATAERQRRSSLRGLKAKAPTGNRGDPGKLPVWRSRFEVDPPFLRASHCHCERCRKHSGTAVCTQTRVMKEQFRLVQGADLVRVYGKGEGAVKAFCEVCGSSLFGGDWPDGDQVSIRMGAFDDDPGIRPQFHTFVADQAPWDRITDDLPQYPEAWTGAQRV